MCKLPVTKNLCTLFYTPGQLRNHQQVRFNTCFYSIQTIQNTKKTGCYHRTSCLSYYFYIFSKTTILITFLGYIGCNCSFCSSSTVSIESPEPDAISSTESFPIFRNLLAVSIFVAFSASNLSLST